MRHTFWIWLTIGVSLLSFRSYAKEVEVLPTEQELISTEPEKIVTTVFRITNLTAEAHDYNAIVQLPDNWSIITPMLPFRLEAKTADIQIIGFLVPGRTLAGIYHVTYIVSDIKNPDHSDKYMISVKVLPVNKIEVVLIEAPEQIIAGESFKAIFAIYNESNIEQTVKLKAKSSHEYKLQQSFEEIVMPSGTMSRLSVEVKTDENLSKRSTHYTNLNVTIASDSTFKNSNSAKTELYPRISGEKNKYRSLPTTLKLTQAMENQGSTKYASQAEIAGKGFLDQANTHHVDFLFRAPNIQDKSYIAKYDEYYIKYKNDKFSLDLGDNSYELTPLTDNYTYGRGVRSSYQWNQIYFAGMYQEHRWSKNDEKDIAAQVGYLFNPKNVLSFNFHNESETDKSSNVFSIHNQIKDWLNSNLELEYAYGLNDDTKGSNAVYLNLEGTQSILTYRIKYVLAQPDFPGEYADRKYYSADISLKPIKDLTLSGYYRQNQSNLDIDSTVGDAYKESYYHTGIYYRFPIGTDVSLEYQENHRYDLFDIQSYDYTETVSRIRFRHTFDEITFNLYGEKTTKDDIITNLIYKNDKLGLLLHYSPIKTQSYGIFLDHNHESEFGLFSNFTFNRNQKLSISYSHLTQNYEQKTTTEKIDINYSYVFRNDSKLKLHAYGLKSTRTNSNRSSLLIEYLMPFGMPIGRKHGIGMVQGSVYDAITEQPIENAVLHINGSTAVTDKDGKYIFPSVHPGNYKLTINSASIGLNKITIQKSPIPIEIVGGENFTYDLGIIEKASLMGNVLLFSSQNAGSTEILEFSNQSDRSLLSAITAIQTNIIEFPLNSSPRESNNTNQNTKGLSNIVVELSNGDQVIRRITNAEGKFYFEELIPGNWTIKVLENNIPEYHQVEITNSNLDLVPGQNLDEYIIKVTPVKRSIKILEVRDVILSDAR